MKTIRISEQVWEAIAAQGRFGETPDDVLRRVFHINATRRTNLNGRVRLADRRMSARVEGNRLVVEFAGGTRRQWNLPQRTDKPAIRTVRDSAVQFAREQGASYGQENAVKKALTDAEYHISK